MRRAPGLLALASLLVAGGTAVAVEGPLPAHRAAAHHAAARVDPDDSARPVRSASRGRGGRSIHGTANINTADEATLEMLPGIGEVMAGRIVALRKTHPFRKSDDLVKVKGIGRKKMAKLRPFITVTGASTLAEVDAPAPLPAAVP